MTVIRTYDDTRAKRPEICKTGTKRLRKYILTKRGDIMSFSKKYSFVFIGMELFVLMPLSFYEENRPAD